MSVLNYSQAPAGARPGEVVLSVAVMTHPARAARAWQLARQHPGWELRVIHDPHPERGSATLGMARAAWAASGHGATHHLVISDDLVFPPGFFGHAAAAAARHPGKALCFFTEWGSQTSSAIRIAALRGASWTEVIDDHLPAAAVLLPAEVARGAAGFMATLRDNVPEDRALHQYLSAADVPRLVSVPNLVNYADLPCLAENSFTGQQRAACYSAEAADAGPCSDTAVTGLTRLPHYAWWHARTESYTRLDAQSDRWEVVRTLPMLASALSVPAQSLEDACTAGLRGVSAGISAAGLVPGVTVRQLWLTAFGLGVIAAEEPARISADALRSPVTTLALASFVPGALRTTLDPGSLAQATAALTPVMHAAVRAGCALKARA